MVLFGIGFFVEKSLFVLSFQLGSDQSFGSSSVAPGYIDWMEIHFDVPVLPRMALVKCYPEEAQCQL